MDKETSNRIPSDEEIEAASNLSVFDEKGNRVPFGSLHAESRTLVIFVRHFFCGMCHNYVVQLSEIPKATLEEVNTELVIIGCGEWKVIDVYKKNTGFQGRIFADPSRALYRHFGMTENIAAGGKDDPKPSYVENTISTTLKSMGRGALEPSSWGKQGNLSQNGGDFILGPGNTCSLAHRMRHSTDHMDFEDLLKEVKGGDAGQDR